MAASPQIETAAVRLILEALLGALEAGAAPGLVAGLAATLSQQVGRPPAPGETFGAAARAVEILQQVQPRP